MSGWQIREYGGINSLEFTNSLKLPALRSSHEVLVEVYTTAVNPLDQMMTGSKKNMHHFNWIDYCLLIVVICYLFKSVYFRMFSFFY